MALDATESRAYAASRAWPRLRAEAQAFLDLPQSLPAALRATLFGAERFQQHGVSLAQAQPVAPRTRLRGAPGFLPRVDDNLRMLRLTRSYLELLDREGDALSPAAEWLLDNFHLIEAQLPEIRDGLPRRYYAELPKLANEPLVGLPRVYGIAWGYVAHTDSSFDAGLLEHFLRAYQQVDQLTLGELWALPTTLRVVLLENLARLAETTATDNAAREAANACCDHQGNMSLQQLERWLERLDRRGARTAFLAQMVQRLRRPVPGEPSRWLAWLDALVPDAQALLAAAQELQAANNVSVSNAVSALRAINNLDWKGLIDEISPLLQWLRRSPAFCQDSELTQDQITHAIERLARQLDCPELQIARQAVALVESDAEGRAAGPAHFLIGRGRAALIEALSSGSARRIERSDRRLSLLTRWWGYAAALGLGSALIVQAMLWAAGARELAPLAWAVVAVLLLLPASEVAIALVHRLLSESVPVPRLPRLGLAGGLEPAQRTLVVVPCLITSAAGIGALVRRLEQHYLANPEHEVQFALLSDGADAPDRHSAADEALIEEARRQVECLSACHPGGVDGSARFLLLHRERQWSQSERCWIGWERKRGKLEQLIALLAGAAPSPFIELGAASRLAGAMHFVITLDADTEMPPGTLRELVGIAAHPLNRPRLDPVTRRVAGGYGILQPNIARPIPSAAERTAFGWMFSAPWGTDAYNSGSSEVYQDVFGQGSFTGKGLLDVGAVHAALSGRVPEGQLLSHDLLEGLWARAAYVSDVSLFETEPGHPDVAASRIHRWTRGDWQLLPFFMRAARGGVGALNLWKMLDNLRRSLLAPASLLLLWASLATGAVAPLAVLLLVLAALGLGPLIGTLTALVPSRLHIGWRHFLGSGALEVARTVAGTLWRFATLPHAAALQVDAIARALWRMAVSRRRLLQWTTAAQAEASASVSAWQFLRRHAGVPALALAWTASVLAAGSPFVVASLALGTLWGLGPLWLWLASLPSGPRPVLARLDAADQDELHAVARDTWRLFERSVSADDHHLPPDNLQLEPTAMLAHRTSPTNIGMYLLSAVCARRLGFIGRGELMQRLSCTLDTLERLPRHRGHLYNWIETQTLHTLAPAYVSTVDSGNLAALLWAVAQALREGVDTPDAAVHAALRRAGERLRQGGGGPGLADWLHDDALDVLLRMDLGRALQHEPEALRARWRAVQTRWLAAPAEERERLELQPLADLLRQLASLLDDREARDADATASAALATLAARCDKFAAAMDFSFLYDRKRRLFHIGYSSADAALDASYYDLLASEARLASYCAIAKGDVPRRHWSALGRPLLSVRGAPTLRSWSGSMFEYLMPSLLMDEPPGGLLERVGVAAVRAQQDFGNAHGVPWGVSECAYYAQDHTLAFQYGPFGVPRLALRRTPPEDRVIAPYATLLAAQVEPVAALANLRRLERLGARGLYGYIEAIDHTASRRGDDGRQQPVTTFMAHHQGMSIAALTNLLCEGGADRPRGWFSRAPLVLAHRALLHERLPREIVFQAGATQRPPPGDVEAAPSTLRVIEPGTVPRGMLPTLLLGNGAYSVALRPNGAGSSSWRSSQVSRSRDDALRDAYGTWLMLRRVGDAGFHSLTRSPHPRPRTRYLARFFNDHAEFAASCDEWESEITVWVSPDDDAEFRRVTLHNLGDEAAEFELQSLFEATLNPQRADESHPAFANLFVQAHVADERCVLLERRARLHGEPGLFAAHFLATCDVEPASVQRGFDRGRVLPRLGRMTQLRPPGVPLQVGDAEHGVPDTGLDPVASLNVRIKVPAQARVCLTFATAAHADRHTLDIVIDKYRQDVYLQRARLMAATLARIRHRELRLDVADIHAIQDLTTLMLQSCPRPRALPAVALDRRALWRFGISGDKPIALLHIDGTQGLPLVQTMLNAHRLWEIAGVASDLVIINGEPASYLLPVAQHIAALRNSLGADRHAQPDRGGVHVLRLHEISAAERAALETCARIDLHADGRSLARLLMRQLWGHAGLAVVGDETEADTDTVTRTDADTDTKATAAERRAAAPGGVRWPEENAPSRFSADGAAFEIAIDGRRVTPRPWANVLANADFGCIVTESGGGFTWAHNSRMNVLTHASNDALLDPPSEHFLVEDLVTRERFGLLPTQERNGLAGFRVVHTQGSSSFAHQRGALAVEVRIAVHRNDAAKCLRVRIVNSGTAARRLRLLGLVEWVLGATRSDRMTLATEFVPEVQAVLARQLEHMGGFGDGTALLMLAGAKVGGWTCARSEFFNSRGELRMPARLGGAHGVGLDPCGALDASVALAGGAALECHWVLGYAPGRDAAVALARRLRAPGALSALFDDVQADWERRLSAITVRTPDALFDALVNRWLPYQTLTCRLWARAGFYQAGGAIGFRDQLQDAMALVLAEPERLRAQLLLHATRQFPEGDVQHWWHPPTGAGVRTRMTDDLLWLPYATSYYLGVTGDARVLDEALPFLEGAVVPEGAEDAYYVPTVSGHEVSLYEHAARTIEHALRVGAHGLPLMGTGDWNDGMNRVGHGGQGESVWLGWFLLVVLDDWIPLAEARAEPARAANWRAARVSIAAALAEHGWDGAWYRRAFFDDGTPLGSQVNSECRIDLIAQAWSVFASPPGDARAAAAMREADRRLVDRDAGLIRLLDPPLAEAVPAAGYIQAYPRGVRENGGQYSHAGCWAVIAMAKLGRADLAWEYFTLLSPAHRSLTAAAQQRYRIEPYVMPGDTYSAAPYAGRGGWSWYSGSAAWMYRAAIEALLGYQKQGERIRFVPCLPPHWREASMRLRVGGREVEVVMTVDRAGAQRSEGAASRVIAPGQWVELRDLPERVTLRLALGAAPGPLVEKTESAASAAL